MVMRFIGISALTCALLFTCLVCFGGNSAQADDPTTYYLAVDGGSTPAIASYYVADTGKYQGSYHIYKVLTPSNDPYTTERVSGSGPDGNGAYRLMKQSSRNEEVGLLLFYVSGE
jgi:hypothetical protein